MRAAIPAGTCVACMSANRLVRAARPLGRSLAALEAARPASRQRFATSSSPRRQAAAGNGPVPRTASAWSLPGVFAVAAVAGLVGWGASELNHRGLPGTVLLDGVSPAPQYASLRQMEQVCSIA